MTKVRLAFVASGVGVLLLFAIPALTNADGVNAAAGQDATCKATCTQLTQQAYSTTPAKPQIQCVPQGGATIPCNYSGPGASVPGICQGGTYDCKATGANGLNGGNAMSSLSQLGQLLGSILSKLGQSSGSGSSAPTTGATGCTTSYYYTSNTAVIGVDPCALYQPATTCSDPNANNYGAQGSCTYNNTSLNSATNTSAQDLLNSLTGSNGTGTTGDILNANPQSGSAPLAVAFSTTPRSTDTGPFSIDPGDGSGAQTLSCASGTGCTYQLNYTYTAAGTYTANLTDGNGLTLASATISVQNPGGPSTGAGGLSQVFGSVGGLNPNAPPSGQASPNFPGVLGNILFDQNGATIFAQTVNSANNSETSGFYGSSTLNGPQNAVGQMCQGRPWASNFLADIIPPSFFDSLCQWGGFQVGQTQTQTQPQVTLTQNPTSAPSQYTAPAATTTTPTVAAQAVIWAVPASVPLGARTSVYWNTQGVTQCNETSPDGSFNENSLSGAQATVPLTGATTYTISCLDPNGNPITNYVTVNISN